MRSIQLPITLLMVGLLPTMLATSCSPLLDTDDGGNEQTGSDTVPPPPNQDDPDNANPDDQDPCSGTDDCQSTIPAAELLETRLSTSRISDGQELQAEYRILAAGDVSATLKCRIIGSALDVLKPIDGDWLVPLKKGDHWYSQTLRVDLPPTVDPGRLEFYFEVTLEGGKVLVSSHTTFLNVGLDHPARVPILMYHYFGEAELDPHMISPAEFKKHMLALKAYGYTAIFLQELMDCRAGLKRWPAKPVVITVDDGVESVYTEMYPILDDLEMKATAFVITKMVGLTGGPYPTMNWKQVRELQASGRFDIQSHGASHIELPQMLPEQLRSELVQARGDIEMELGKPAHFLSYPFGETNIWVKDAAWQAGFRGAVVATGGVEQTCNDKLALARVAIDSSVTVAYNPTQPQAFFMSLIEDPDVVIPVIQIESVTALDPWTDETVDTLLSGRQVKIQVKARNSGPRAKVKAAFALGNAQGIHFKTHDENPWAGDITRVFPTGVSTFEWILSLPGDIPSGQLQIRVRFHDEHRVLQWSESAWQPIFMLE